MLPRSTRHCVFLPDVQWDRLSTVAEQTGKSSSELIRLCLDRCLTVANINKLVPCFSGQVHFDGGEQ